MTFDEMVAALYGTAGPEDLASAEALSGAVVVSVMLEGLPALGARSKKLRDDEVGTGIESPAFLSVCRRHVAALMLSR